MATPILAQRTPLAHLAALVSTAANRIRSRSAAPLPARMLQHAGDSDACGTFTPEDGGPTAIVIGARAPAEALMRLATRHNLEPAALALFAKGA
jgi:hypothetical protein